MPIYLGNTKIERVQNLNEIGEVWVGSNKVFSRHSETLLGKIQIYATGDYAQSLGVNAYAWLVKDKGKTYLKITGSWGNTGDSVSADTQTFSTNINVGAQKNTIGFNCRCFYQGSSYGDYSGYVYSNGTVYLPVAHENRYRSYEQFDYYGTLIQLNPA